MQRLKNKGSRLTMSHITIDTYGVEKLVKKFNPHKSTDSDAIPAHILHQLSAEVAPALSFVFQMSLDVSQIEDD